MKYDVVIIGAGLAGSCLARQLLLKGGKTILHLERLEQVPGPKQKVGESSVQMSGYYFSKVLDLETYLFQEHLMKYNLRFLWKTAGNDNDCITHYSQSYIRRFSNIASYQLDRNKFEADLIGFNRQDPNYTLVLGARDLDVALEEDKPHRVRWSHQGSPQQAEATWVVDTSGRKMFMARRDRLVREAPLTHGASFFWLDGIVDLEKMTPLSPADIRLHPMRRSLGHLPNWLATNHFMGDGFWFWVIPLKHRTSFGLVYDMERVDPLQVSNHRKLRVWLFKTFPLLEQTLGDKPFIDFQTLRNYSTDVVQTISRNRWAVSGFAGRFTDPLYSPGSDAIALHNTLIVDAIHTDNNQALAGKVTLFESMMRVHFRSFLPSFQYYRALGDQECFSMKYTWELAIYFAMFVFPLINDLYTDRAFLAGYFRRISRLGDLNRDLQALIQDYYLWKQKHQGEPLEPFYFDLLDVEALQQAESTFYKVGLTAREALAELDVQLGWLEDLAMGVAAHIQAVKIGETSPFSDPNYLKALDLKNVAQSSQSPGETVDPNRNWLACPRVFQKAFQGSAVSAVEN